MEVLDAKGGQRTCSCAIQKDGGDDPDVTSGLRIYAKVTLCERQEAEAICQKFQQSEKSNLKAAASVGITAGEGVGIVTLPGLEQSIGAPAINRVPREMITKEVQAVCEKYHYTEGVEVCISVPNGAVVAEKTFNPRLGIKGGISILGTSGIVEPMSEQALISSIQVEMKQKSAGDRKYLLIAPGNYGLQYLSGNYTFEAEEAVKCSNYVGQTIDFAVNMGLKGVLFVAHIGKFIKVAGGIMNTHSHEGDCRMELLAAAGIRENVSLECLKKILDCVTTEEALAFIDAEGKKEDVMEDIMKKIDFYLKKRAAGRLQIACIVYSNTYGLLGMTAKAEELLRRLL